VHSARATPSTQRSTGSRTTNSVRRAQPAIWLSTTTPCAPFASSFSVTQKGVGGAIQFVFLPHIEFGLNAAQGTIWSIKGNGEFDAKGSLTRTSFGGFANISNGSRKYPLLFGVGSLFTRYEDQNSPFSNGVVDKYWQMQNFVAVQYVAFQQLYIKLVGGYARGHWLTADDDPPIVYDDEMYSVRLRFAFYF
jgi:hypothetical protein